MDMRLRMQVARYNRLRQRCLERDDSAQPTAADDEIKPAGPEDIAETGANSHAEPGQADETPVPLARPRGVSEADDARARLRALAASLTDGAASP
jgi:hypothetical protein